MDLSKKIRKHRGLAELRRQAMVAGRYGRTLAQRAYEATRRNAVSSRVVKIEVQQLGLATGKIVPVRVIKRKRIEVVYIP